ncbi:MAG: IS66 family transposase [Clostridia bacterium]|nr:IS66 family transposase [Clostridia bacterium]
MFKESYGSWAKKRIAELERHRDTLFDQITTAKTTEAESFNRFKREEHRRMEAEAQLSAQRREMALLQVENRRLQNLTAEHAALLEELEKSRTELKWERRKVHRLEKQLNRRTGKEGYFGLATPSALKINKPKATPENRAKKGGAPIGHPGHGRTDFPITEADQISEINGIPPPCSCDGSEWLPGKVVEHCVIERIPARTIKHFYLKTEFTCSVCGQRTVLQTPGVVPGGLYGNSVVAHLLTEHYLHGLTAGAVCRCEGIREGTFFKMAARSAALLTPVYEQLQQSLKTCKLIHADETGWRNDGDKAYGWIFIHPELAVFLFRNTRSGKVPREIFGTDPLDINFVSDRYKGYDCLNVNRQYCYVHLLRDLLSLEKDFPEEPEVTAFVASIKPLLKAAIAMYHSKQEITDYILAATALKNRIVAAIEHEANHPGIQTFQDIFRRHPERCFQWVKSPEIPAENNLAERGLRPSVIARKISFGSQSEQGMHTREVLMTFLHTARLRGHDPGVILERALNLLCLDPQADVLTLLAS